MILVCLPFAAYGALGALFTVLLVKRLSAQFQERDKSLLRLPYWWHDNLLTLSRIGMIVLAVTTIIH